jgi:hypothetical protein
MICAVQNSIPDKIPQIIADGFVTYNLVKYIAISSIHYYI